jgi:hypothetical protein
MQPAPGGVQQAENERKRACECATGSTAAIPSTRATLLWLSSVLFLLSVVSFPSNTLALSSADPWGAGGGGGRGWGGAPRGANNAYEYDPRRPPYGGEEEWGDEGDEGGYYDEYDVAAYESRPPPPRPKPRPRPSSRRAEQEYEVEEEEELEDHEGLVKEYTSTLKGKALVSSSSAVVVAALGAALSESTIRKTKSLALGGLGTGLVLSFTKGPFGDLTRSLGLGAALTLYRSSQIGAEYPLLPHLKSAMGLGGRLAFPPGEKGPWRYRPGPGDPIFSMARSMLALAFMGAFIGYTISKFVPLLPTALMAIAAAGGLAWLGNLDIRVGDLARVMAMRLVALLGLAAEIDSEVRVTTNLARVFRVCLRGALFWDRKFQLTDKAMAALQKIFAWVSSLLSRMQAEGGGADFEEDEEGDYPLPGRM